MHQRRSCPSVGARAVSRGVDMTRPGANSRGRSARRLLRAATWWEGSEKPEGTGGSAERAEPALHGMHLSTCGVERLLVRRSPRPFSDRVTGTFARGPPSCRCCHSARWAGCAEGRLPHDGFDRSVSPRIATVTSGTREGHIPSDSVELRRISGRDVRYTGSARPSTTTNSVSPAHTPPRRRRRFRSRHPVDRQSPTGPRGGTEETGVPALTRKKEPLLTAKEIHEITDSIGKCHTAHQHGMPSPKKGTLDEALGVAIVYEHAARAATVRSRPSFPYRQWLCPRGDLNPHAR